MIEVILVDDHTLFKEGLKKILDKEANYIQVVDTLSYASELRSYLENNTPDLVILDVNLPDCHGLNVLKDLQHYSPDVPVLMLSSYPENRFSLRSLKSGAMGYLTKKSVPEELITAIKTIVEKNKKYISNTVAEELAESIDHIDSDKDPHHKLSNREFQVFQMIANGKQVKKIAEDLNLSVRTIHTYRSRVMKKMGFNSDVELTHYAFDYQLVK